MANDSRDRKLQDFEKRVWTTAFNESLKHTSVEGAERNAWKAVAIWHRVGIFNGMSERSQPKVDAGAEACYREAFGNLRNWLGKLPVTIGPNLDSSRLFQAVLAFDNGEIEIEEFRSELHAIAD